MKRHILLLGGLMLLSALPAIAVDHNNIDAHRPLDFDDAETIAYREKSFEVGTELGFPQGGKAGISGDAEFLYGFAPNWHLSVGLSPEYAAGENGQRQLSLGDTSIGVMHNFNRETESTPAFGIRLDATLPTGRDSEGIDFRLRGIASRSVGAYGRLHLNLDLDVNNSPATSERRTRPGVIVGYSRPLGYPTRFDRTLVAQLGLRSAAHKGDSTTVNIGLGIRQQVTPSSVFDIGLKSDIAGDDREKLSLVAGYSTAF